MTRLVLASRSPRRAALLAMVGLDPLVAPSSAAEDALPGESPEDQVLRLGQAKAEEVAANCVAGDLVVGADTLVVLGERVLGQPRSEEEAREMLGLLAGMTHRVLTGICLVRPGVGSAAGLSESTVSFHPMSAQEIAWYVGTGEPMDKAGAYAAQGLGAVFLAHIEGSFHNVVGFPLDLFYQMLPKVGLDLKDLVNPRFRDSVIPQKRNRNHKPPNRGIT